MTAKPKLALGMVALEYHLRENPNRITFPHEAVEDIRRLMGDNARLDESVAALLAENARLRAALTETLAALEVHLDEATRDAGLGNRSLLCPCHENEVQRARAALSAERAK